MPRPPHRALALLALLAPLALTPACSPEAGASGPNGSEGSNGEPEDPTAASARELPKVRTATVRRDDVQRVLETTAPVESVSEIAVVAEASGRVLEVLVQEGDAVAKGQVLARLDARDQEIAVADARVSLAEARSAVEAADVAEREAAARTRSAQLAFAQAQRDLDRNLELTKGDEVSPLSVQAIETSRLARDNAEEDLKQTELAEEKAAIETTRLKSAARRAELVLERNERDLERTTLLAPIDGVVASRTVEPGRNLTLGEVAFELTDLENLRVRFFRPQRELALFTGNADLGLTATTEARPGATFTGAIQRTSPVIDRASGSFRVTAHLDPASAPDGEGHSARLLPGMLLRLFVVTGVHTDTLVVPKRAVRREGAEAFVLAVAEGVVRRVPVTEGYTTDTDVEVLLNDPARGLAAGDEVIVVGSRELQDGDAVRVENVSAAEVAAKVTDAAAADESAGADAEGAGAASPGPSPGSSTDSSTSAPTDASGAGTEDGASGTTDDA